MEQDRPSDAARAYARAVEIHNDDSAYPLWSLWLFRGGAFDEADDWPQTKEALEQAYRLAPEQPLVLNYLGYAQLERRENMVEAERLVREAHRLAPDNAAITDSLGWALFLKGELPEALTLLEQAAEGEPVDVEITVHPATPATPPAGSRPVLPGRGPRYAEGETHPPRRQDDSGLTPRLAAR
jgi:Flp pilus assembly protein TadD